MKSPSGNEVLKRLYAAALEACDPEPAVARALLARDVRTVLSRARRIGLFAVGKAAAAMARGALIRESDSLVILPRGYPEDGLAGRNVLFAAHPDPDSASVLAAKAAVRFFRGFSHDDVIVSLVSGGASSLLCLPRSGLTLSAKRASIRRLADSGASIVALNLLRTSLSAIKGGRLGRMTGARLVTLVLSDVPGDRPALVGSGPTIRRRKEDVVAIIGSNRTGLEAARREAVHLGYDAPVAKREISGEARQAGARFAAAARRLPPGSALLAGGETTVRLGTRAGRGGRSLEFAIAAALELEGADGVAVLAATSDGRDGSSRAAGAVVDGGTIDRAKRKGLEASVALRRHASEDFLARAGGLIVTGPTGTNVRDWAFALRGHREVRAGRFKLFRYARGLPPGG